MKKWGFLLLLAAAVSLIGLSAHSAHAQDNSFNIVTSPLPISLSTQPGQTVSTELRVKNTGNSTTRIKVGLMKFSASGDLGQPDLMDRGAQDSYFDWVSFTPAVFDAQPNQWMTTKMTIKTPPTASLGYYYAVTFSPANPTKSSSDQSHTNYIGSTATLVLLDVKTGNEKRVMHIASLSSNHSFYQFLPASFAVKIHNDGNIHSVPSGTLFINRGDKTVSKVGFNDAGGNILPNTNRVFKLDWKDGFPVYEDVLVNDKPVFKKDGSPKRHLKWDLGKITHMRFGKYTAKLLAVYNDGQRDVPLQAEVSFWVVPWSLIFLLVAIPTVPALAVYFLMRWRFKKRLAREQTKGSKKHE